MKAHIKVAVQRIEHLAQWHEQLLYTQIRKKLCISPKRLRYTDTRELDNNLKKETKMHKCIHLTMYDYRLHTTRISSMHYNKIILFYYI